MDITSAAIATGISAVTASIVSLLIYRKTTKRALDERLEKIIQIAIQYPYLEDINFTQTWNPSKVSDDKYLRYELYCNLVFNYLESISIHYYFRKKKISSFLNAKDWARLHSNCWKNPSSPYENVDSYNKKFRHIFNEWIQ
jgi:hypothetical protein